MRIGVLLFLLGLLGLLDLLVGIPINELILSKRVLFIHRLREQLAPGGTIVDTRHGGDDAG